MEKILGLLMSIFLVQATRVWAHPVSFKDSFSVMSWNQPFFTDFMATYTLRNTGAIAAHYMRMDMEEGEMKMVMPGWNQRMHRWNALDWQANIYMVGGFGWEELEAEEGTAGLLGVEADMESRKYLLSARFHSFYPSEGPDVMTMAEWRGGVAAYLSEFEELSSWFILQIQHHPQFIDNVTVTPMLRLFYRNALTEVGASLEGDYVLNMMVHF